MRENRGNVVVVEDDSGLNRAFARLLRISGFTPLSFHSAETLLSSNAMLYAECFVIDVHLPGISGIELRRRLDAARISKPVIFITAHDDEEIRVAARSAVACLRKPFTGQTLIDTINDALRGASN